MLALIEKERLNPQDVSIIEPREPLLRKAIEKSGTGNFRACLFIGYEGKEWVLKTSGPDGVQAWVQGAAEVLKPLWGLKGTGCRLVQYDEGQGLRWWSMIPYLPRAVRCPLTRLLDSDEEVLRIALFDLYIGNKDRDTRNILVVGGKLVLIDEMCATASGVGFGLVRDEHVMPVLLRNKDLASKLWVSVNKPACIKAAEELLRSGPRPKSALFLRRLVSRGINSFVDGWVRECESWWRKR